MKKITLIVFAAALLCAIPLAAQNSPAGGSATGGAINRDIDLYMLVNFAPYVAYTDFFSYAQANAAGVGAGFGKKLGNGGFLHFYTTGNFLTLTDKVKESDNGSKTWEEPGAIGGADGGGRFTLQFDTLYGNPQIGTFKLGLNFAGVGQDVDLTENAANSDYTKETTNYGTITPALTWGKNWINADYSMFLFNAALAVGIPTSNGSIQETKAGSTTTTVTKNDSPVTATLTPGIFYFFAPKDGHVTSIHANNAIFMRFYQEENQKTETSLGTATREQKREYFSNTLTGYVNRQYVLNPRFVFAWRVIGQIAVTAGKDGEEKTKPPVGSTTSNETVTETFGLTALVMPRVAVSYQLVPQVLTLNGSIAVTGPMYLFNQTKVTDSSGASTVVTTTETNTFSGMNAAFGAGFAWNLTPNFILDAGVAATAAGNGMNLSSITIAAVYKK
jgi:hypothetical protein